MRALSVLSVITTSLGLRGQTVGRVLRKGQGPGVVRVLGGDPDGREKLKRLPDIRLRELETKRDSRDLENIRRSAKGETDS